MVIKIFPREIKSEPTNTNTNIIIIFPNTNLFDATLKLKFGSFKLAAKLF